MTYELCLKITWGDRNRRGKGLKQDWLSADNCWNWWRLCDFHDTVHPTDGYFPQWKVWWIFFLEDIMWVLNMPWVSQTFFFFKRMILVEINGRGGFLGTNNSQHATMTVVAGKEQGSMVLPTTTVSPAWFPQERDFCFLSTQKPRSCVTVLGGDNWKLSKW